MFVLFGGGLLEHKRGVLLESAYGLKSKSIGNVAGRIMKAAHIRQSNGDRKGFHIFGHHFATTLLGNGVQKPIISKTLGHTSPRSLEAYLKADFHHLKECSISIDCFQVSKEVFYHV
jgi:integrase